MNTKPIKFALLTVGLIAILVASAFAANDNDGHRRKLIGTWLCDVPGEPPFRALQTFHADSTFTETSSLLGQGQEGPAHGVWIRDDDEYQLTFQLFAFDPTTGETTGMIRVRVSLIVDSPDHLTATFGVVEFIDPDGTITELVRGPDAYTCTRLKVVPVP
jgi:hypothetical protein